MQLMQPKNSSSSIIFTIFFCTLTKEDIFEYENKWATRENIFFKSRAVVLFLFPVFILFDRLCFVIGVYGTKTFRYT